MMKKKAEAGMAKVGATRSDVLVLFGVSGDLAHKKIFPALYAMEKRGALKVPVIGVASSKWSLDHLRKRVTDSIKRSGGIDDQDSLQQLLSRFRYVEGDYNDQDTFTAIKKALEGARRPAHYLAIPPALFANVIRGLGAADLTDHARVIVEKPFGRDLASARELNRVAHAAFPEDSIFRIDHYLGKGAIMNILFTTHTAVAAGFDRFSPALIERFLGEYTRRQLFRSLFPRWPQNEVPVGHVTNGVHMPSWDSAAADELWTEARGKDRWLGTTEDLERAIRRVPDAKLRQFRADASASFVEYVRERLSGQPAASGGSPEELDNVRRFFDPQALTVGFARRFAAYKRPNLLLHDSERPLRLLTNPERPVQLVLAGKAHPADQAGQGLIRQWTQFIRRPEVRPHVIFLDDYDMLLSERLVQGVDLWLNTPRRPWEASGTSGMKVLVNGGIDLSELDGWWAEAEALYDPFEREVIPEFYARGANGIPTAWVARMRESMAQLTPRFSTNRAVREYTEQHYLPAASAYRERSAGNGAIGLQLVNWRPVAAGDGTRGAILGRDEWHSVSGSGTRSPAGYGLYGSARSPPRERGGPPGSRSHSVAALIHPRRVKE